MMLLSSPVAKNLLPDIRLRSYTQWEVYFALRNRLRRGQAPAIDLMGYETSSEFPQQNSVTHSPEHAERSYIEASIAVTSTGATYRSSRLLSAVVRMTA
jgi:hypothetical protein